MASASKTVGKKTWTGDETLNRNGDGAISTPVLVFTDAESRDDLYSLGVVSSAADAARPKTADSKAGAMPTRRKPHLADFALESPPIAHTSKPESFDLPPTFVNNPYPVVGIGLALGSPSQSPWIYDEVAARSVSTLDTRGNSPLNTPASVHGNGLEDGAKDKGRRKMFGSLFAKKPVSHPVSPAAPFYKAQYPKSANQVQPYLPSNLSAPSRHRRVTSRSLDNIHGSTIAKSKPTTWTPVSLPPRPSLKKAPSAPIANKIRSPTPPPKDYPTRPVTAAVVTQEPPQPPQADLLLPQDQMQKPSSNLKLLEINIPDVSMERYSIMFSDVLKPRQSLLARRQAHLPQLKMDNDSRVSSNESQANVSTNSDRMTSQGVPKTIYLSAELPYHRLHIRCFLFRLRIKRHLRLFSTVYRHYHDPLRLRLFPLQMLVGQCTPKGRTQGSALPYIPRLKAPIRQLL